ncbi:hypothetical protein U1Q18_003340 [Sarracenia purpurea var. burkii]
MPPNFFGDSVGCCYGPVLRWARGIFGGIDNFLLALLPSKTNFVGPGPSRPGIEGLNTLKEMPKSLSFEEKEKEGRISSPTHFEKEEILGNLGNEEQGPQFYIQNSLHESKLEPSIVSEEERAVDEDVDF